MTKIIPAIDLIGGQCVRLEKGDYNRLTVYSAHPAEVARCFVRAGYNRIHVVDLDGARMGRIVNKDTLRAICSVDGVEVDFGGGIRTENDLQTAFDCGARWVTAGSIAATDSQLTERWIARFGASRFILGADVNDGRIAIKGWKEDSGISLWDFLEHYHSLGINKVLCTNIQRDGLMQGPDTELYKSIMNRYPDVELIASGGVGDATDIESLSRDGIPAVVVGKAIYEGRIRIPGLELCTEGRHSSLAKRIIPCLDVKDGLTVKGTNFVNFREAGDPVALGKAYSDAGADELVFLDITASAEGRKTFTQVVSRVAEELNIPFTVGGGISEIADVERLLTAGADKVSVNSAALRRPELINEIARRFGSQCVVCAIDAREETTGEWRCFVNGGRVPTERGLFEWASEAADRGAGEILFTSMNHDGTQQGYANEALARLADELPIPVIASGGAGKMEDFLNVFARGKADAALAASVFHFGEIAIPELKHYLLRHGINVRV